MSAVSRALQDVRDDRSRCIVACCGPAWDLGLTRTAKFKKSAFVVDETMKYHLARRRIHLAISISPHGAEFFVALPARTRPGKSRFADGDSWAAMRYTEAKPEGIAEELLLDIEKETVD